MPAPVEPYRLFVRGGIEMASTNKSQLAPDARDNAPALDAIDEASADSFPASDPPSWTPLQARPPAPVDAEAELCKSFSEAERRENLLATRWIEDLLLAVFSVGLLMYLVLCVWM